MDIKSLNAKVDYLVQLRKERSVLNDSITTLREAFELTLADKLNSLRIAGEQINKEQEELLAILKESNTKAWKTDKATISRKSSYSYKIVDDKKLFMNLKELNLVKEYTKVEFLPQIKGLFEKQDFDGVEKTEKEFISVLVKPE